MPLSRENGRYDSVKSHIKNTPSFTLIVPCYILFIFQSIRFQVPLFLLRRLIRSSNTQFEGNPLSAVCDCFDPCFNNQISDKEMGGASVLEEKVQGGYLQGLQGHHLENLRVDVRVIIK